MMTPIRWDWIESRNEFWLSSDILSDYNFIYGELKIEEKIILELASLANIKIKGDKYYPVAVFTKEDADFLLEKYNELYRK